MDGFDIAAFSRKDGARAPQENLGAQSASVLKAFGRHFRTRDALVASSVCTQIRDPEKRARVTMEITRGTYAQATQDSGYIEIYIF